MPCWTRTRIRLKAAEPVKQMSSVSMTLERANIDLLMRALSSMGITSARSGQGLIWKGGSYQNNTIRVTGENTGVCEAMCGDIKRRYSAEIVKYAATRFGWSVQQTEQDTFAIQRRF